MVVRLQHCSDSSSNTNSCSQSGSMLPNLCRYLPIPARISCRLRVFFFWLNYAVKPSSSSVRGWEWLNNSVMLSPSSWAIVATSFTIFGSSSNLSEIIYTFRPYFIHTSWCDLLILSAFSWLLSQWRGPYLIPYKQ